MCCSVFVIADLGVKRKADGENYPTLSGQTILRNTNVPSP